ncbi:hypothetical protein Nepgr_023632 [Nepenthes gracilis]|uniref:Glycosyltransferase n=1 Tax=Nepenthes gracilis TaxID=150966 RepID=A0AAD3T2T9_NEPGR|nr:hypothetical protein Nepgr_023632 [Nepenthes gracilis]
MAAAIVLYPAPGIGHLLSMIELSKLINHRYNHRFNMTILLTTGYFDTPNTDAFISSVALAYPSLSFIRYPYVPVDTSPTRSRAAICFEFIRLNDSNVLHSLKQISQTSKIQAFIIDFFCTSALTFASELKIPTYYFFTSGHAALAAYLYMPTIHKQVSKSFKDLKGTVLHFPGLPTIPATHMPEPLLDRGDPAYNDMIYFSSHLPKSDGILVNTFDELEPVAMAAISSGSCVPDMPTPPIYNIGPLIAQENLETGDGGRRHECFSWLDSQPSRSVVFLCFGSRGTFELSQVREIANGLEKSEQRFLWVVKKGGSDLGSLLPDGFLERTKEKGLVVEDWAPQVAVLSHDSVGVFVTHCGWNSVLESVVAGKPMVAWPLYAEQHVNKAALVEDMKMAIPVEGREEDGMVAGDKLANLLTEFMDSEKGKALREKSKEMREKALAAMGGINGSSVAALAKLVSTWTPGVSGRSDPA